MGVAGPVRVMKSLWSALRIMFLRKFIARYFPFHIQRLTSIKFATRELPDNASAFGGADDADRDDHRGYLYFSRLYRIWLGIGLGGAPNERLSQSLSHCHSAAPAAGREPGRGGEAPERLVAWRTARSGARRRVGGLDPGQGVYCSRLL